MKPFLVLCLLATFTVSINGLFDFHKKNKTTTGDYRIQSNVKIYSNLAEIIQPLGLLPLEFSAEDWSDIRADSVTLVGLNVTITEQTITEKKKSLNNVRVHVRSPSSSDKETKFVEATIIDEKRNLVKLNDKDISKGPIYLTVPSDHIVYNDEPPQSKYYVNFTYSTTDAVYVSYLRSNLNWKTRYQLNLFDESKSPILISMADIRNDGQSTIHIDHAELLGGDINLQMSGRPQIMEASGYYNQMAYQKGPPGMSPSVSYSPPSVKQGEELAGLYVFTINKPFSIDAKTDYLLPMFRPRVTVERYGSISNYFYGTAGNSKGKAQRSYRLTSDRFLSRGDCIIRESDRLVGETSLPDLAAKDKHEFSLGQDPDVIYKENITLVSSRSYNVTVRPGSREVQERTEAVYDVHVLFKNFKKSRSVKIEYEQRVSGQTVKLIKPNPTFTLDGTTIKHTFTLNADEEKVFTHKFEAIS
jgi:hypothetical protein